MLKKKTNPKLGRYVKNLAMKRENKKLIKLQYERWRLGPQLSFSTFPETKGGHEDT